MIDYNGQFNESRCDVEYKKMKLVDIHDFSLCYSGLQFIYAYDFRRIAAYFAKQVADLPEVEAVPCEFIEECISNSSGTESAYYKRLLEKWKKYKDNNDQNGQ